MSKRFCFILPKFAPENIGGAELQVLYLCLELVDRGHEVHYIREKTDSIVGPECWRGIRLHSIPKMKFFFFQWLNAFPLIYQLIKVQPDVVYCRVSKSYLAVSALASIGRGFSLIWACSHEREVSEFRPRTDNRIKRSFERFEHSIFSRGLKRTSQRLVQTEVQRKLLLGNFNLESTVLENAHPLPDWIETHRESNVLWVANFRDFKRPDLFIALARMLRDRPYKFIMIGKIDTAKTNASIQNALEDLPNFQYFGPKNVEEVEDILWRSRLLVNTSDHEGFPNTYIQALMRGVPIVALNVDPNDMIKGHKLGKVMANLESAADSINRFMSDDEFWKRISQNCRCFSERQFSIGRYTDSFLSSLEG